MIFKVAGCYGSELPGYHSAGFLVNGRLLLEAGTVTSILTWEEQLGVTEVCVSHIHLDHVKELAFLVDNRAGKTPRPLVVTGVRRGRRRTAATPVQRSDLAGLHPHPLATRADPGLPGHPRGAVLPGLRSLHKARAGQPPGCRPPGTSFANRGPRCSTPATPAPRQPSGRPRGTCGISRPSSWSAHSPAAWRTSRWPAAI